MTSKFAKRLEEFLSSECSDYSLSYTWEWNCDTQWCDVLVKREDTGSSVELRFRYNNLSEDLIIELGEDIYQTTREFDPTVKYFWMKVAPVIFSNN